MQPRLLQLRRLVIGEAGRFPELGQTFYEQGPGRTVAALAGARVPRRLRPALSDAAQRGFFAVWASLPETCATRRSSMNGS